MDSVKNFILARMVHCIFALVLLMCVSACKPTVPEAAKTYAAGVTGYNFTAEGVQRFTVNTGSGGGNIGPYGGGGSTTCCVVVPSQWRPGLVAKIDWKIGHYTLPFSKMKHLTDDQVHACCWVDRTLTKTVPIEPYSEPGGDFQVFFLPNDEVKVWVHTGGPDSPNHPSGMSYPRNPNAEQKE